MKKSILSVFVISICMSLSAQKWQPADPEATPEAKQLFARLIKIQEKGIMYGQIGRASCKERV